MAKREATAGFRNAGWTMGQLPEGAVTLVENVAQAERVRISDPAKLAFITQTTLSVDETRAIINRLRERFPSIVGPRTDDICYATTNRQAAISELAGRADGVIVVGETFSSNAVRLAELAGRECPLVQLIADSSQLDWSALPEGGGTVAVTAAASTPEASVADVVGALGQRYRLTVMEESQRVESTEFGRVRIAPLAAR